MYLSPFPSQLNLLTLSPCLSVNLLTLSPCLSVMDCELPEDRDLASPFLSKQHCLAQGKQQEASTVLTMKKGPNTRPVQRHGHTGDNNEDLNTRPMQKQRHIGDCQCGQEEFIISAQKQV